MLIEILCIGGAVGMVTGVFQLASRRRLAAWTAEAAVREAMRGPEAAAVRAEYRRSGIVPPVRPPQPSRSAIVF